MLGWGIRSPSQSYGKHCTGDISFNYNLLGASAVGFWEKKHLTEMYYNEIIFGLHSFGSVVKYVIYHAGNFEGN